MATKNGQEMIQVAADAADDIRNSLRDVSLSGQGSVHILDDSLSMLQKTTSVVDNGIKTQLLEYEDENTISVHNHTSDSTLLESDKGYKRWYVDPLRLTVTFPHRSALAIDDRMCEEKHIYCELNMPLCITYGIPPGATMESLKVLKQALLEEHDVHVDATVDDAPSVPSLRDTSAFVVAKNDDLDTQPSAIQPVTTNNGITKIITNGLRHGRTMSVPLHEAINHLSAETICIYPPGIPLLVRGELVTIAHVNTLETLARSLSLLKNRETSSNSVSDEDNDEAMVETLVGSGCTVTGCVDSTLQTIKIITHRT